MPRTSPTAVDPVFAEVAKAIYGDIDPRELVAKFSPGSSDVHVDRPVGEKEARRQRKVALVGLGATGVASAAGLHAVSASVGEHKHRMAAARGEKLPPPKVGRVARLARKMKLSPTGTAAAIGGGLLALHGVELGADALGIHAQTKALRQANKSIPKKPVTKAFRLKPLNALPIRVPSLRAKRVKLTPLPANPRTRAGLYQPMSKGVRSAWQAGKKTVKNVQDVTERAEKLSRDAEKTSNKVQALIPSPRVAALGAGGTVTLLTGATYAGTRHGTYAGTRAGARPRKEKKLRQVVAKSELEVTWTGEIAKVDTEQRQVFGWASVSAINGEQIVDLQGDIVPIEEMEKSAYRYVVESRKGGDMHQRVVKADEPLHTADMIESFVVTPEKLEKMGLPADSLPHGWWVGYHVNDDAQWELVKSGGRKGFSIHGKGSRTPVSKADGRPKLRERAEQAVHPPAVRLHSVKSSAVAAMGYQRQTRRLAYEMRSRPGQPYEYRVKAGAARDALEAPSKGYHFATQVRGKAKRAKRRTPADRARLFLDPVEKADHTPARNGKLPGDNRDAEMARTRRNIGLGTATTGYLLASRSKEVAPDVAGVGMRSAKRVGEEVHAARLARRVKLIGSASSKGGGALIGAGLLLAAEGGVNDLRNRGSFGRTKRQFKQKVSEKLAKSAFGVEDDRVSKAFDSERSRHGRNDLYAGGAAGGVVVAGSGAVAATRGAKRHRIRSEAEHRAANASQVKLQNSLASPAKLNTDWVEAGQHHGKTLHHQKKAVEFARKAKRLSRVSGGLAGSAAALGAGALALHDYDRRRGGRSYGY